ncbi:MAG TPA: hypothetical protein VIS99_06670 [Terrimicrobiaceae bacterium]
MTLLENPKASAPARKKAIVALARRLSVDLWRIATGRVKAEELNLVRKKITSKPIRRIFALQESIEHLKQFGTAHARDRR